MPKLLDPKRVFATVVGAAVSLSALLIVASVLGAHAADATRAAAPAPPERGSLFAGIPQHGTVLGSPAAPLTLVEYADLQCPYCAQWARSALPVVVERYVRTGKVRLVFNGLAFIGPDSEQALRTALAAGEQGHLWDVVHGLYLRQGAENSGWVARETGRVAAGVAGLDLSKLRGELGSATVDAAIRRAFAAAQATGVRSTPSFQLGATGGPLQLLRIGSLDARGITPAIDAELAK